MTITAARKALALLGDIWVNTSTPGAEAMKIKDVWRQEIAVIDAALPPSPDAGTEDQLMRAVTERDAWNRSTSVEYPHELMLSQAISLKRIADALERLIPRSQLLRPDGTPNSITDIARQGE